MAPGNRRSGGKLGDGELSALSEHLGRAYSLQIQSIRQIGAVGPLQERAFLVHTDDGALFVKTVKQESAVDGPLAWSAAFRNGVIIQDYLVTQGFPVPIPVRTREGGLFFRYGDDIGAASSCIAGNPFEPSLDNLQALGELVARLHTTPVPEPLRGLPARLEPTHQLGYMKRALARHEKALPSERRWIAVDALGLVSALAGFDHLPRALVHTDLAWGNLILDTAGNLHLIDFDGAGVGPPITDLPEITSYLVEVRDGTAELDAAGAEAFYSGYRRRRRLSQEELAALPAAHRYHQLLCLTWHLEVGQYPNAERRLTRIRAWDKGLYPHLARVASGGAGQEAA